MLQICILRFSPTERVVSVRVPVVSPASIQHLWRAVFSGWILLLVVVWSAPVTAFSQASFPRPDLAPSTTVQETIKVGMASDYFPYAYTDEQGRSAGFSLDLLAAVARVAGFRLQPIRDPQLALETRFITGELEVISSYTPTPERETFAEFSIPYLTLPGCVFVNKKASLISRWDDLMHREFALVGERSVGEKFLRDRGLKVVPVYVASSEEGLRLVESGQCAGVFVPYLTGLAIIQAQHLGNVTRFGDPVAGYDLRLCFAVHQGDAARLARINEGLATLHRTGEYAQVYHKWFGHDDASAFPREQVVGYLAAALVLSLVALFWWILRWRSLKRLVARQAAELAERDALLKALSHNLPIAMAVIEKLTHGYRILALNRSGETIFGSTAQDAVGKRLDELTLEEEWKQYLESSLQRWPMGPEPVREEHKLAVAHKLLVVSLIPLSPTAEGNKRLCILAEDVTERRELDEEVSQSRKLRAVGELVGGIAHEFNNLLTPVMLQIGGIQADWPNDPPLHQALDVINRAMNRAAELTRRLLTFGRRAERRFEPIQLATIVDSCLEILRQTIDRRVLLDKQLQENLSPLIFNSADLQQVLLNLLLNARDTLQEKLAARSTDWQPVIRVEAVSLPPETVSSPAIRAQGNLVAWQRLTVRDNGMGMTPEVKERIFEPFYTTKEVGRGSGLGLATVWHIATEAGGRVDVDSVPGEGSTFQVYFPVWSAPERVHRSAPGPSVSAPAALRIFLAEDDDLVARTVISALRRSAHTVTHFSDGGSAWSHLQEHAAHFDLLIFDVNMPGIDGIELSRRVRGPLHYTGKILIISGRLTSENMNALTDANVDSLLPKPFTSEQLIEAVNRARPTPGGFRSGREHATSV